MVKPPVTRTVAPPPPKPPGALFAKKGNTTPAPTSQPVKGVPGALTAKGGTGYKVPTTPQMQQSLAGAAAAKASYEPPPAPVTGRTQAPAMEASSRGGRGGGGGGGGYSGPRSLSDFDWFKSDPFFRTAAGGAQSDLVDQLAQLLFEQGQGYQGIDNARRQWGMSRDRSSLDLGQNFAARGLNQSGLYMQGLQDLLRDYEESAGQIDQSEASIGQQLGQRNSMADLMAAEARMGLGERGGPLRREALFDDNYNALADIYGRLGQRGVTAGNRYQSMLNQMRAQSAGRSNDNIINTLGW